MTTTPGPSPSPDPSPARLSAWHPVNVGHLVMGLVLVGLVVVWALVQGDVVGSDDIRWLLPVPWVLAGIAGLLATTLTNRGRWATRQIGWVPPAPTPTPATASTDDTVPPEHTDPTQEIR
ncbi:MAG: hypothetical protein ACXVEC_11680 [Nocardioides sp.]